MTRSMAPIAIIGLSGRFPGASDVAQFWDLLISGREGIRRLSEADLRAAGVPDHIRQQPNFVAAEPVLDDIDLFDADFFGLSPRDATALSPAMRLFLECSHEAFETADFNLQRTDVIGDECFPLLLVVRERLLDKLHVWISFGALSKKLCALSF